MRLDEALRQSPWPQRLTTPPVNQWQPPDLEGWQFDEGPAGDWEFRMWRRLQFLDRMRRALGDEMVYKPVPDSQYESSRYRDPRRVPRLKRNPKVPI